MAKDKLTIEEKDALKLVGKTIEAVKVESYNGSDINGYEIFFTDGTKLDIIATMAGGWGNGYGALFVDLIAKPKAT